MILFKGIFYLIYLVVKYYNVIVFLINIYKFYFDNNDGDGAIYKYVLYIWLFTNNYFLNDKEEVKLFGFFTFKKRCISCLSKELILFLFCAYKSSTQYFLQQSIILLKMIKRPKKLKYLIKIFWCFKGIKFNHHINICCFENKEKCDVNT